MYGVTKDIFQRGKSYFLVLGYEKTNFSMLSYVQIVTNGIYKSTEHRAIVNEDKDRISIATFLSPKLDGDLGPAPSLLTPQCPAEFRRIGVADYFKGYFSQELVGKSYVDSIRIRNGDDGSN